MSIPHLDYFRRDGHGYHFRIRQDSEYWNANRAILSSFHGQGLKWNQTTHLFNLPINSRTMRGLANIFPEEWAIIQAMDTDEITFEEEKE